MEHKQTELTVITKAKDLCSFVMTVTQKSIQERMDKLVAEKAEQERIAAEEKERKIESGDFVDFDSEEYYDVICPNCTAELSYMPWQDDEDSSVVCPDCDYKFKINFGGNR